MPDHVHFLVYPKTTQVEISQLLSAMKQPHSFRIKKILEEGESLLLAKLTIQERPGKKTFRYWQEGPGYDRNLSTEKSVMSAIDYIHNNRVRRGLVKESTDWKWSSARWYASEGKEIDNDLPTIHGLPWDFFLSTK